MTDALDHLADPRAARRRAVAIADEYHWGDRYDDPLAKRYFDLAVAWMVEALQTAHLSDVEFVNDRVRKRLTDRFARAKQQ